MNELLIGFIILKDFGSHEVLKSETTLQCFDCTSKKGRFRVISSFHTLTPLHHGKVKKIFPKLSSF